MEDVNKRVEAGALREQNKRLWLKGRVRVRVTLTLTLTRNLGALQ